MQLNASDYLEVASSTHTRVGQVLAIDAGQQVHFKAGATMVVDGGPLMTLMAGGQHLLLTPAGVYSSTPILPGGVAVPGVPAEPGVPGQLEGMTSVALTDQMHAFERSACEVEPVCLVCEQLKEVQP